MGIDLRDKNLTILDEGVDVSSGTSSINFEGSGVNVAAVGDNVTVTIPGGNGTTTFYMNQTVAQSPYKEFSSVATSAVEQVVPLTVTGFGYGIIAEFMTPTGVPNTTQIPSGLWQLFLHFNAASTIQNWIVRPSIYKRSSGGTETLIIDLDPIVVTDMATVTTMYVSDGVFPATTLLTTDRIVIKIRMDNTTGSSQTVNFRTEGSQHYSVGLTTLNQVVPAGAVTDVTGTSPVVSSGGSAPAISIPQATNTVSGYISSSDWATFKGKQDTITLTTTGSSGASTLVGSTLNIPNYAGGSTGGVFGISNSSGVYTYYTTLTLAMAAATSGQVIEMFADVTETGAVSISLKTGVNINGNGHTYTLNNSGTSNCIQDNGVSVYCEIFNIKFKRTGATASTTAALPLYVTNAASQIINNGVSYESNFGLALTTFGKVTGGYFRGELSNNLSLKVESSGILINADFYSAIGYANIAGTAINCTFRSDGSQAISCSANTARLIKCVGYSSASYGISASGYLFNCVGYSTSNSGIYSTDSTAVVENCAGYSTGVCGIQGVGDFINSVGESTANAGIFGASIINCTAKSSAAKATWLSGKMYNSTSICTWNNASGHAVELQVTNTEVVECVLQVTNATANAIYTGTAYTCKYAINAFKGATSPININVTQGIVNTHDNQGNILI